MRTALNRSVSLESVFLSYVMYRTTDGSAGLLDLESAREHPTD
jgi:hypothetical protein